MTLLPLPDQRETVVLVGTTVRKPLAVLKPYLDSLAWQELPTRVRMVPCFVPDFTPEQADAQDYLFRWVNERGGTLLQGVPSQAVDFSDDPIHDSHQWQLASMLRVGEHKNRIIQFALAVHVDYLFFADADLILDTTTLASLLAADRPIVTATYWTRWSKRQGEKSEPVSGPQVWLQHPYQLFGRGMEEPEFRAKLLDRNVHRVWGFGACTLLQRRVLEAGVNFSHVPGVPTDGLMGGEDRHFCIQAERRHIQAFADGWPDIFHIYHADQHVPRVPEMVARLGRVHHRCARLGDLVSLRLRPLEPLPVSPTQYQQSTPVTLRGRLGTLKLLPEIEEAVYNTERGQTVVERVHFPIHYPVPFLRGRTRLMELTVVDIKPYGFPPIVEEELRVGPNSGAWQDVAALTPQQQVMPDG